jgi:hypothetical protein
MMARFSTGDVDKPTHATIVKGFHKYTRAAISPEGMISTNNTNTAVHQLLKDESKHK